MNSNNWFAMFDLLLIIAGAITIGHALGPAVGWGVFMIAVAIKPTYKS